MTSEIFPVFSFHRFMGFILLIRYFSHGPRQPRRAIQPLFLVSVAANSLTGMNKHFFTIYGDISQAV